MSERAASQPRRSDHPFGRGPELLAKLIDVELTVHESKAIRMALAFGVPPRLDPDDPLVSARDKLLAAERKASNAI